MQKLRSLPRVIARLIVRAYQLCISPLFPPCCRFYPTCSAYASEAIERFGCVRGLYLAITRIGRCHPLCHGGVDLVPMTFSWRPWRHQAQCANERSAT